MGANQRFSLNAFYFRWANKRRQTETETEAETETETKTETDRRTDRQTSRQTGRQTNIGKLRLMFLDRAEEQLDYEVVGRNPGLY